MAQWTVEVGTLTLQPGATYGQGGEGLSTMAIRTLQEEKHFQLQTVLAKVTCMYSPQVLNCCLHTDTTVMTMTKWSKYEAVLYKWGYTSH